MIKQIQFGSKEYKEAIQLRFEVLRKPLGMKYHQEDLDREVHDFHMAACEENKIVGCLILTPLNATELKMRQVAVLPELQGTGIGRQLVKAAEELALQHGFQWVRLHARDTAVNFYLSLGYQIEGEVFTEVNIPHRLMKKKIGSMNSIN